MAQEIPGTSPFRKKRSKDINFNGFNPPNSNDTLTDWDLMPELIHLGKSAYQSLYGLASRAQLRNHPEAKEIDNEMRFKIKCQIEKRKIRNFLWNKKSHKKL